MIPAQLRSALLEELRGSWVGLADKPDETPDSTMDALVAASGGNETIIRDLVQRRNEGEPLAYLLGRQVFMGIEMLADRSALIPRRETEILCRGALDKIPIAASCRVLDVCCGGGNLGLAVAALRPGAVVAGSDISEPAVALAIRNAVHLRLSARAQFHVGDLFGPFNIPGYPGEMDLILCNPPYISSARVDRMPREISGFEPRLAFDGGPFGVKILTRLVREAWRFLKPEGWLAFEVGRGQGPAMRKILESSAFYRDMELLPNAGGETRALLARAAASECTSSTAARLLPNSFK